MKLVIFFALFAVAMAASPYDIQLLRFENENNIDSYRFGYEQSDGSQRDEQGQLKNAGTDNEAYSVQGSYAWVGPDGVSYTVTYLADENGFQPQIQQGAGGSIPSAVVASFLG